MNKKKTTPAELDVCTDAPEYAEHARPNEPPRDACDDGRAGTAKSEDELKEVNTMTDDKKKNEDCEDIVNERKEERQRTMDKMSQDTSEAETYNEDKSDNT